MEVKMFEIRDRMTFIPVMAVLIQAWDETGSAARDRFLLERAGFGETPCVQLVHFGKSKTEWDPYAWNDRTMSIAHNYILAHWQELFSGMVIDVEYILGETQAPKQTEAGG